MAPDYRIYRVMGRITKRKFNGIQIKKVRKEPLLGIVPVVALFLVLPIRGQDFS